MFNVHLHALGVALIQQSNAGWNYTQLEFVCLTPRGTRSIW